IPELRAPITRLSDMLVEHSSDGVSLEPSLVHQHASTNPPAALRSQLAPKPFREGNAEAHLAALEEAVRKPVADGPPEDQLSSLSPDLQFGGYPGAKFNQLVVQQWGTTFEGVRHRHPIHLHQQLLREVRHDVGAPHPRQGVSARGLVVMREV